MPDRDFITDYSGIVDTYLDRLIPGDFAEFGVYNGGFSVKLVKYGRKVWAFDTYEGLPEQDYTSSVDSDNPPGDFKAVPDTFEFLSSIPNIIPIKGRFIDTLSQIPKGLVFSLVYIDCDYYLSHLQVLQYLTVNNHIISGSIIIFDDYNNLTGTKKAVDEWRQGLELEYDNKVIVYDREKHLAE